MTVAAWLLAVVLFDLPLFVSVAVWRRRRNRHRALRRLVASYSHLPPGRVA